MKKIFLLSTILCMLTYITQAQDNRALQIYGDGTSFFLSGLEETLVTDLTIEGWVKIDGAVALDDYTALVDFRNASTGDSKALIFKNSGGATISYEWNGNWTYINGDNFVPADEWAHVAIVVSGDDQEARFFVNGMQTGSDSGYSGLGDELTLGENIRVGAGLGAEPIRTLIGVMDEIRIWTVARTEDEIYENMAKQIDPSSDGLLMYYRCNEEDGADMLKDETGNGYDLPVSGTDYEFIDDTEWYTDQTSVTDEMNAQIISIYPNPVKDQLLIKGLVLQNAVLKIHDLSGQLLEERIIHTSALDVSEYKSGMYLLEIQQDEHIYNGKFIKK